MSADSSDEEVRRYMYESVKKNWRRFSLLIILAFTLLTRLQGYKNLKLGEEWRVLGNDSWYHLRATNYSIENFPSLLGLDAKTAYPEGSTPGAFGTLYDLLHATVGYIIGLGSPSAETIQLIAIISSPIFSVLTVLMLYILTTHVTESKTAGLSASAALALIPGTFYQRGYAGFYQHHIAEALLLLIVIYGVIRCIEYAEDRVIIVELLRTDGITDDIKTLIKYVSLCSLSIFVYFLVWQPSAMFVGVIALSGMIYAVINNSRDRTSQPTLVTLTAIVCLTVPMVLVQIPEADFGLANTSLLHLSATLFSSLLLIFVTALDRVSVNRDWTVSAYAGSLLGLGLLSLGLFYLVSPSGFSSALDAGLRLLGYPLDIGSQSEGIQTIGEEQSTNISELASSQYGLLIIVSFASLLYLGVRVAKQILSGESFAPSVLISVMYLFVLLISLGTVRFNYYLAPMVSLMAGIFVNTVLKQSNLLEIDSLTDVSKSQVLSIIIVIVLFVPVLIVPVNGGFTVYDDRNLGSGYQQWEGSLEWLSENSPDDNIDPFGDYGDSFDYENSYGVMSWWDYGHWITTTGNRTPVANPLQSNVEESSEFLLAQNSSEAEEVISELGSKNNVEEATARYIMIDWQMVSPFSKFGAITAWNEDENYGDYFTPYYTTSGQGAQTSFFQKTQKFHESMMGRLYLHHGSAVDASTRTVEYDTSAGVRAIEPVANPIVNHTNLTEAKSYQPEGLQVSRGGIAGSPPNSIEALEHYRLVKSSLGRSYQTREIGIGYLNINRSTSENIGVRDFNDVPSTVKTFERVEGVQVRLSGYEEGNYTLEVDVTATTAPRTNTFTYKQNLNIESESTTTTVPYSTTGYDERDKNPDVRGSSSYRLVDDDSGRVLETFEVNESDVVSESETIEIQASN